MIKYINRPKEFIPHILKSEMLQPAIILSIIIAPVMLLYIFILAIPGAIINKIIEKKKVRHQEK